MSVLVSVESSSLESICKLFLSCSGLSGGFNFVLVYFLNIIIFFFGGGDYMYVVLVKSLWAASIVGHVGYSGSLP